MILLKRQSMAFSMTIVVVSLYFSPVALCFVFTGTSAGSVGAKPLGNSSVSFKFRGTPTEPLWAVSL